MARVAVAHNTLDLRGGADAVCMHVCGALQDDHDVALVTVSETTLAALNETFGTEVRVEVEQPPLSGPLARAFGAAAPYVGPQLPLRSVLLAAFLRRRAEDFDLVVSTANEFDVPLPSVQYVHFPQFHHRHCPAADAGRLNPLWSRLAGPRDRRLPTDATVLANSAWTADVVAATYDRRPAVLHPPVDPVSDPLPWADREYGLVLVGRIAPDKRTLTGIEIVDRVRERGHDCHLHVVGTVAPAYRRYARRVERAAGEREYVSFEPDVPRECLEHLLRTHRYALNAKPGEHFGMALAECAAAGMLPFAPDGGGQRDVVGDPERLFDSPADGADAVARAIERDDRPTASRDRFASDRFRAAIRRYVAQSL